MKQYLLTAMVIMGTLSCKSQDSTELPKSNAKPGRYLGHIYVSKVLVPSYFLDALDSINHMPLNIMENAAFVEKKQIPVKPEREFKSFSDDRQGWFMTYIHRYGKPHYHFVIYIMKNNRIFKITTGIAVNVIDGLNTLERLKGTDQITFINLKSTTNSHKF